MVNQFEDQFIAIGSKLEAVDACITALLDGYLSSFHGRESSEDAQEYRRASAFAFVAADYISQADKLLWELEADVDTAIQTTRIDVAASVVISGPAKQRRTAQEEVMTCAR